MPDKQEVMNTFVDALATRLAADRKGDTTVAMRAACAKARAEAVKTMTTSEYDAAVARAFEEAGLGF
jgi:hypothetical protein